MKEIKAADLRIGNLVSYLGENVVCDINTIWAISNIVPPTIMYTPIPLTEDWLLRFGFDKNDEGRYDKRMELSLVDNCYHFRQGWTNVKIEYVHTLQNLYHALTGEELTIKE